MVIELELVVSVLAEVLAKRVDIVGIVVVETPVALAADDVEESPFPNYNGGL